MNIVRCDICGRECTDRHAILEVSTSSSIEKEFVMDICRASDGGDVGCDQGLFRYLKSKPLSDETKRRLEIHGSRL